MLNPDYINVKLEVIDGLNQYINVLIMPCLQGFPHFNLGAAFKTIEMILGNMFAQWCNNRHLSFCKDRKAYQEDKIGNPPYWYRPTYVTRCFKELERLGVIETEVMRTGYKHIPSKAYPTNWLIRVIFEKITFPSPPFKKDLVVRRGPKRRRRTINSKTGKAEYHWIKGPKKPVLSHDPGVKENRTFLEALNKHIGQANITARKTTKKLSAIDILVYAHMRGRIGSDIKTPKGLRQQIESKPVGWTFQLLDLVLFRSFNEDYVHGGRLYGSIHEELPKEIRKSIEIDGEETVELDYSGLHVRMLYHRKGIDYKDDPYDLADIPRRLVKRPSLAMINAGSEASARKSIFQYLITDEDETGRKYRKKDFQRRVWNLTNEIVEAFKEKHEAIANDLFSGIGLELQYQDSELMKNILQKLMNLGVVCLPVHDSILCKKRQGRVVKWAMIEEYRRLFGLSPIIS